MKYGLYEGNSRSGQPLLTAELNDNFAAENWAKDWLKANAKGDTFCLERDDGAWSMIVFRTQAGQWYLTPNQVIPQPAQLAA